MEFWPAALRLGQDDEDDKDDDEDDDDDDDDHDDHDNDHDVHSVTFSTLVMYLAQRKAEQTGAHLEYGVAAPRESRESEDG